MPTPKKTRRKARVVAKKITVSLAQVLNSPRKRETKHETKTKAFVRVQANPITPTTTSSTTTTTTDTTNWYVALFDFTGDATYHMMSGLLAGDVIRIVRRGESGWWWAHHMKRENGHVKVREGYVPADFLKPVQIDTPDLIEPEEASTVPQSTPSNSVDNPSRPKDQGEKEQKEHKLNLVKQQKQKQKQKQQHQKQKNQLGIQSSRGRTTTTATKLSHESISTSKITSNTTKNITSAASVTTKQRTTHNRRTRKTQRRYRSHDPRPRPRTAPTSSFIANTPNTTDTTNTTNTANTAYTANTANTANTTNTAKFTSPPSSSSTSTRDKKTNSSLFWQNWLKGEDDTNTAKSNKSNTSKSQEKMFNKRTKRTTPTSASYSKPSKPSTTTSTSSSQRIGRNRTPKTKRNGRTNRTNITKRSSSTTPLSGRRRTNKTNKTTSSTTSTSSKPRISLASSRKAEPFRWTLRIPKSNLRSQQKNSLPQKSSTSTVHLKQKQQQQQQQQVPRRKSQSKPPVPIQKRRSKIQAFVQHTNQKSPRSRSQASSRNTVASGGGFRSARAGSGARGSGTKSVKKGRGTKGSEEKESGARGGRGINEESNTNDGWTTVSYKKKQDNINNTNHKNSNTRTPRKHSNNRNSSSRNGRGSSVPPRDFNSDRLKESRLKSKTSSKHKTERSYPNVNSNHIKSKTTSTAAAAAAAAAAVKSRPTNTLDMFRKVYGRDTTSVSVDAMAPMSNPRRGRKKKSNGSSRSSRGKSAPPIQHNRFWVPPLETDYEISLKVVRGIARDGDISLQESLAATQMLLQRDSVLLGALGIQKKDAQFSEDMENDDESMQRMALFMNSKKHLLTRMKDKVMG